MSHNPSRLEHSWLIKVARPVIFEHISALLETAIQYSVLLIERAIVGLFRLTSLIINKVGTERDFTAASELNFFQPSMRDQLYIALDLIGRLPPSIAFSAAEQIVSGVVPLIQTPDIVR